MKIKNKKRKPNIREILYDADEKRSLTTLYAIATHEFNKVGLLSKFEDVVDTIGNGGSAAYKLLKTYIDDAKKNPVQNDKTETPVDKGYQTITLDILDLEALRRYAKPFKRELSKLVLEKFGSYLEYSKKAKLQPSNISKFFNQQVHSKPRMATMEKFAKLLGTTEITIKIYPEDEVKN